MLECLQNKNVFHMIYMYHFPSSRVHASSLLARQYTLYCHMFYKPCKIYVGALHLNIEDLKKCVNKPLQKRLETA